VDDTGKSGDWKQQLTRLGDARCNEERTPADGSPRCAKHPDAEAAFFCVQCRQLLCSTCSPDRRRGWTAFHFCPDCRGMCEPLRESEPRRGHLASVGVAGAGTDVPTTSRSFAEAVLSALRLPFRGIGSLILLLWSLVIYLSWPLWVFLFAPYLWAVHKSVERGQEELLPPWRVGGGPVHWLGRLMGFFAACLPVLICLAFVIPIPSATGGRQSPGILALALGGPCLVALVAILPLMVTVVLRTGNPLLAYNVKLLGDLLRRFRGAYLRLLASQTAIVASAIVVHALLRGTLALVGADHMVDPVIDPGRIAMIIPWVLGPLWLMIDLAFFARSLSRETGRLTMAR